MPDRPDIAIPSAITTIARAASPAATYGVISGLTVSIPPGSVAEAEQAGREIDPLDLELLDELGPDPGRLEAALDLALHNTGLLEDEDVLHHDDVTFHALDFGDVGDAPGPVLEARLVHDQVHRRG